MTDFDIKSEVPFQRLDLNQQFKKSFEENIEDILKRVVQKFKQRISALLKLWEVSEQAKKAYPFLVNKNSYIKGYIKSIKIDASGVYSDPEVLKKYKLPVNFPQMLEYGTSLIPILSHWGELPIFIETEMKYFRQKFFAGIK